MTTPAPIPGRFAASAQFRNKLRNTGLKSSNQHRYNDLAYIPTDEYNQYVNELHAIMDEMHHAKDALGKTVNGYKEVMVLVTKLENKLNRQYTIYKTLKSRYNVKRKALTALLEKRRQIKKGSYNDKSWFGRSNEKLKDLSIEDLTFMATNTNLGKSDARLIKQQAARKQQMKRAQNIQKTRMRNEIMANKSLTHEIKLLRLRQRDLFSEQQNAHNKAVYHANYLRSKRDIEMNSALNQSKKNASIKKLNQDYAEKMGTGTEAPNAVGHVVEDEQAYKLKKTAIQSDMLMKSNERNLKLLNLDYGKKINYLNKAYASNKYLKEFYMNNLNLEYFLAMIDLDVSLSKEDKIKQKKAIKREINKKQRELKYNNDMREVLTNDEGLKNYYKASNTTPDQQLFRLYKENQIRKIDEQESPQHNIAERKNNTQKNFASMPSNKKSTLLNQIRRTYG